jgi:hypothetical protein
MAVICMWRWRVSRISRVRLQAVQDHLQAVAQEVVLGAGELGLQAVQAVPPRLLRQVDEGQDELGIGGLARGEHHHHERPRHGLDDLPGIGDEDGAGGAAEDQDERLHVEDQAEHAAVVEDVIDGPAAAEETEQRHEIHVSWPPLSGAG